MALRRPPGDYYLTFAACAIEPGRRVRPGQSCPEHGSTACVESFYSQSRLAGYSLWHLIGMWRRWRRYGRTPSLPVPRDEG